MNRAEWTSCRVVHVGVVGESAQPAATVNVALERILCPLPAPHVAATEITKLRAARQGRKKASPRSALRPAALAQCTSPVTQSQNASLFLPIGISCGAVPARSVRTALVARAALGRWEVTATLFNSALTLRTPPARFSTSTMPGQHLAGKERGETVSPSATKVVDGQVHAECLGPLDGAGCGLRAASCRG